MRGELLNYDVNTAEGIISGEDGNRYKFKGVDLREDAAKLRKGMVLDFDQQDGAASDIYIAGKAIGTGTSSGAVGSKSNIAAGILAILLGGLGVHKFYLGYHGAGIITLLIFIFGIILLAIPTVIISIIALVEGIIYLVKTDEEFYQQYEVENRPWF